MKQRIFFLVGLLAAVISLHAAEVTVVVADTAGSLIYNATVKNMCTRQCYKSSVDGRAAVIVSGKQLLRVSADGYNTRQLRWNGKDSIMWVTLKPSKVKTSGGRTVYKGGSPRGRLTGTKAYKGETVMYSMATADYAEAEVMAEPLIAYGTGSKTAPSTNSVTAGKLTAGEVNDFAKWNLWSSVLGGELGQYTKDWRIDLGERYLVQVTNKDGFPLANRYVTLTDADGRTRYQARTDNTGKAELWGKGEWLAMDGQRIKAQPFGKGMNILRTDEPCEVGESADVLFVVDATGSMGDEITYLQAEMKDVIRRSQNAVEGLQIRTGAVFYRDYSDEYLTRISRLNDDIETTQRFIDKQYASGGGDYEEAVPEALKSALNVAGWNDEARTRILFLVLDAPCHKDSATLAMLNEQILNAASMGVRIVPVVCSGLGKSGELLMRQMALATNGTSFFLTDDSGIGGAHIKPSTDSLKVEHLNDMLVRTIVEFSTMPSCRGQQEEEDEINVAFIPDPFDARDLENNPSIPHGKGVHYLVDVSGKLLGIFEGEDVPTDRLPIGVYFVKTYYDGQWFTRKLPVY